jgi:hypothetical protein
MNLGDLIAALYAQQPTTEQQMWAPWDQLYGPPQMRHQGPQAVTPVLPAPPHAQMMPEYMWSTNKFDGPWELPLPAPAFRMTR